MRSPWVREPAATTGLIARDFPPRPHNLFHTHPSHTPPVLALQRGAEFAAAANCSTLACLEALPLPDLLRASRDVSTPVRLVGTVLFSPRHFLS
jgi:hypothetical protein